MNDTMTKRTPTIAVTGATGFLGSHLCAEILRRGCGLIAVSRRAGVLEFEGSHPVIGAGDNFTELGVGMLEGADAVIHCAARVHQQHEEKLGEQALHDAYLAANVDAALQVARAASAAGVRRFVFVSSVHVHARATAPDETLSAASPCRPQSHYARSKFRAEQALSEFCRTTHLELVIVRPPLVYGAGVKAKFAQLARWVASGMQPRNWRVPPVLLRLALSLIGRSGMLSVLDGSLALDISENRDILGWKPVETMQQALPQVFAGDEKGAAGRAHPNK